MSTELRQALEQVARRFRGVRLWCALAVCWLVWAIIGVSLTLAPASSVGEPSWRLVAIFAAMAALSGAACVVLVLRGARDPRWVARRVEKAHPELNAALLAAVEEVSTTPPGKLGFLQTAVIRHALNHREEHNWDDTVPTWTLRGSQVAHAAALAALVLAATGLFAQARIHANNPAAIALSADTPDIQVEPGDAAIERGAPLLVVARFNRGVPGEASLVVEDAASSETRRLMTRSLEDPTFAGRVDSVATDLAYHIAFGGQKSKTYKVTVFEYPELQRADAKLVFPGYTSLEPKTVEDIRHVTAVEGTELTLLCRLNKDVAEATLVDPEGQSMELKPAAEIGPHVYRATFTLDDPRRLKVLLKDREGRSNKLKSDLVVNVTRNRPPVVTTSQPARDVRVSPLEELTLKAKLEDDFGVIRHGVSYTVAGAEPKEIALEGSGPKVKRIAAEHLLDFESFHAAPDQLVTYFFWAEDFGPDGQPRRASGDMYFAEVRHFEEIFRQGEQPPGGSAENEESQGQNAQDANKLAELQKEIINATWKLIRRETRAKPTDKFAPDVKLVQESQQSAIEQADALAGNLRDATSKASLEQATKFMKEAEKTLGGALTDASIKALSTAFVPEQAAYQALLKLRAREFNVVRNNQRQRQNSRSSSSGPSQRQLNQLELKADENRYEEQTKAQQNKLSPKEQEQRENRQVASRLKELAQRQADLNERLKELQSALEAAKTEQAKQEIERQLKRLRDQQQQVLRDTDELRERMEREENRDRMAEARQQIEESREHVRQASEALEAGQLAQAGTEGARAERQLSDLKEDIRKKTSDRFSEEMTEMRDQARKLDADQTKLSEQLEARNNPAARPQAQPSLRGADEREQVQKGLEQQRATLDQLLDRMRTTVEAAEETEPLLAKSLYETVRKTAEQKVPDELKIAEQLAEAGVDEDAAKSSRRAGEGITQLRQGVERAAESVLGDDVTALRRAKAELDDLADQVNREIARAAGPEGQQPGQQGQQPRQQAQQRQQGQQPGQQGQQGEKQGQQRGQQGEQQGQQGQQPGQRGQQGQQGQQPGQQGQQQGQPGQQGQQPGQQGQQQGQQPGQQGQQGQQQGQGNQPGQQGQRQGGQAGGRQGGGGNPQGGLDRVLDGFNNDNNGPGGPGGPITGEGFRQWSDRMRDVEELLQNPEMRAEAARIRDRARGAREDYKRHATEPDWTKLKGMVADPIRELRDRVAEEVRRRESPDALVPIDRDPVPPQYSEGVRRYYERLGSGR